MKGHDFGPKGASTQTCRYCEVVRRWKDRNWHYYRDAKARKALRLPPGEGVWPHDYCNGRPIEENHERRTPEPQP